MKYADYIRAYFSIVIHKQLCNLRFTTVLVVLNSKIILCQYLSILFVLFIAEN